MSRQGSPYSLSGRMAEVKRRLEKTRGRWLRWKLGAGLVWIWGLGAAALLGLTLAGMAWDIGAFRFSAASWVLLLGGVAASAWVIVRALRAWPSVLEFALRLGEHDPRVRTRILAGLELWDKRGPGREGYSRALIEAVAEDTWRLASDADFESLVPSRALGRSGWVLAVPLAGWMVLALAASDAVVSTWTHLPVLFTGESIPAVWVEPGDCEILAGESLEIRAIVEAPDVREATVLYARTGQGWRAASMAEDAVGAGPGASVFRHLFGRVDRPFRYAVQSGKTRSDTFRVDIRARPKIVRLRVDYDYPAYTGLPERRGPEGEGKITALKGTEAAVWVEASRRLNRVEFVIDDRDTLRAELREDSRRASGKIPVLGDGKYVVRVVDEDGYAQDRADTYPIVCLPDESPLVRLASPPVEAALPADMTVILRGAAHDDFGFSKIDLRYFLPDSREEALRISGPVRVKEYEVDYTWRLGDLGLLPGDVVTYYVEAWDNDAVSGPKRWATDLHALRFPSVAEIFAQASRVEEEELEELRDVYEEEQFLKDRLQEISRDIKREETVRWEAKKEIEQAAASQEEVNEKLERVAEGLDEAVEILEKNELLSLEILEKMARLRDLVREVATPEMLEAMKNLQKALGELDREEIEEALKEFELSQEDLLERLERSIELLERLRIEKKMEELAQVAEALAERQTDLAGEARDAVADSLGELAPREGRIAEETQALEREVSSTADEASRLEPEASNALEAVAAAMEEDEVVSRLEAARDALSQGDESGARSLTHGGAQDLQRLAEQLRLAQNALSVGKRRELAKAIERVVHDLVWFSFEEEDIASGVGTLRTRDLDARREVADRQLSLRTSASQLLQRLRQLERMTFLVSPEASRAVVGAMEHMEASARILEAGNLTPADREGMEAMALLNRAVLVLMESKDCMSSCSSPMGLNEVLQRMQSMSCKQGGINQATQGLFSQAGQQGLSMEARAQMARLAAEQEAVKKTAEALAAELGNQPQILGRMEGIISDLQKVVGDLESMSLRTETIERQHRVLSRLLDAQKSIRRRDYARIRLSRVGTEEGEVSPAELPASTRWTPSEIREDLLKAAGETYPLRYESLIRSYFRSLTREEVREPSATGAP